MGAGVSDAEICDGVGVAIATDSETFPDGEPSGLTGEHPVKVRANALAVTSSGLPLNRAMTISFICHRSGYAIASELLFSE